MLITNYFKDGILGRPGSFDEEIEGELLPCPICGRIPKPTISADSLDKYQAVISCFVGGCTSHAHVLVKGAHYNTYYDALNDALSKWNSGDINYFEDLNNVFRNCFTCIHYEKPLGEPIGVCKLYKFIDNKMLGCDDDYERVSHEEWKKRLTR